MNNFHFVLLLLTQSLSSLLSNQFARYDILKGILCVLNAGLYNLFIKKIADSNQKVFAYVYIKRSSLQLSF